MYGNRSGRVEIEQEGLNDVDHFRPPRRVDGHLMMRQHDPEVPSKTKQSTQLTTNKIIDEKSERKIKTRTSPY